MPSPSARALEQRETASDALEAVPVALVPFIEGLPVEDSMTAQIRISQKLPATP